MPRQEIDVTPYKPTPAERLRRTVKVLGAAVVATTAIEVGVVPRCAAWRRF
ncbi:MAG TPA: hypothetical protein VGE30_01075 [Candidatus Saccharimonadales bacterium]